MRKWVIYILILSLLFTLSTSVSANSAVSVSIDGKSVYFSGNEGAPQIVDGRVMVPIRKIFSELGALLEYDKGNITAIRNDITITYTIGQNIAYRNGQPITLDVPGQIMNFRTMVPLRFVSEALGAIVEWDSSASKVNISSPQQQKKQQQVEAEANTLYGWGHNYYGQLGDGTIQLKDKPVRIGATDDWLQVSAGDKHNLAIRIDGTLWTWGHNQHGQLGDGTYVQRNSPIKIDSSTDWLRVSAGNAHSLAIRKDGTLWAWGANGNGQLGDGTNISKMYPTQVGTSRDWIRIDAGTSMSAAIKRDGTIWVWGAGFINRSNEPVRYSSSTNWKDLSLGVAHLLAIQSDGTLWAAGWNAEGQLGDGTKSDRNKLVQVGQSRDWALVSAGRYHSLGIKQDGSLWAWGSNEDGQLGDGTKVDKMMPVRIGSSQNWKHVSTGSYDSIAIKQDGSLWTWGNNQYGQSGDGTKVDKLSPVRRGSSTDWSVVSGGDLYYLALRKGEANDTSMNETATTSPPINSTKTIKTAKEIAQLRDRVGFVEVYNSFGEIIATGSGVMIEPNYFVTNFHVAALGKTNLVYIDGQIYDTQSRYLFGNEPLDLWGTILAEKYGQNGVPSGKQPTKYLPYTTQLPEVGDKVYAIGSPYGLVNSVSDGIVSGIRNVNGAILIQHTADIASGSSGGALLNEYGEVIGINSSGIPGSNLEFAVPMSYVYQEFMNPTKY